MHHWSWTSKISVSLDGEHCFHLKSNFLVLGGQKQEEKMKKKKKNTTLELEHNAKWASELPLFVQPGRQNTSCRQNYLKKKNKKKKNKNKKKNIYIFSRKNISRSLLGILKKQYLTVFDLCYVFEVQTKLSLDFATVKASEKKKKKKKKKHLEMLTI